ncbi:MAG: hypothetical protein II997_07185 [Clostridia bacterium]|nr:hypothetical protein [Clostridia bacterium]
MNERIEKLVKKTVAGEMWVEPVSTEYDKKDLFLSPMKMSGKRVCEYILNQEPLILEESCLTGLIRFDDSVEGDVFNRSGHKNFAVAYEIFYLHPVDNLLSFEWQHSVGDFFKVIQNGLNGIKNDIEKSKTAHEGDESAIEFLDTQYDLCNAIIGLAHKASQKALVVAKETKNPEYQKNLMRLSESLKKVPEYPAESFYEAVLSLYFCYPYIPDSIGLIDRYLYPYFRQDIDNKIVTKEEAASYLQELFLMLQARKHISEDTFHRGGESHFCLGGYLTNGEDGFNDLSRLIVEALLELPTWIPQVSLRWTEKTPTEVLRFMLNCERKDPNKRIAFVNDEPRLKGLMNHAGLSFEEAVGYTMMGCNELALPGGMVFGFDPMNVVRSVENTFYKRSDDLVKAESFEEFYAIYEEELFSDLWEVERISKGFQNIRSRDCNIVSNIFLEGCIENAKSCTQGGLTRYIAVGLPIGLSNVIDSLAITRQFVYDEKRVTMEELICALRNNWKGFEMLRAEILKRGNFFGNDDSCSNEVAQKLMQSLEKWNNTENYLQKKWLFGNLIGYHPYHKWFGEATQATPDGRFAGDMVNFGIGQTQGKDRKGMTALLNAIAKCDPGAVLTGPSVTNVLLDEQLIKNDDHFEKLVKLFETYFSLGGTHFQLTYVSKDDLIEAQKTPEKYRNLRVRVSGFSDYFVFLNEGLQNEIIARTKHTS